MDKRCGPGCLEPFVPTFDFSNSVNNVEKAISNEKKYSQKEFYSIVHKNSSNNSDNIKKTDKKGNEEWKARKRLQHHLQILTEHYGDHYGYFD
jgi:hypothetical protein